MDPLPIDAHLDGLVETARRHRALVLVAEPGAGKTTRLPPALLRGDVLSPQAPALVLLQPRRVAARAAAARIADENGWELGHQVGYHVRFERRLGPHTRLRVLTEGILARQLIDDPLLEGVGCVVLDEFHERSVHSDLALAMLKEVRQTVREDLVLVVMSATLDAESVSRYLGGCPIAQIPGRTFPVHTMHLPMPAAGPLADSAADSVTRLVESGEAGSGDVLVFLPGVAEIRSALRQLEPLAARNDLLLLPLHGNLPLDEQVRAIRPAQQRKVVLSTNIAQTSLTIDGVTAVIDTGVARVAGFDHSRGLDRLDLWPISKAAATQRAGRAGRTRPGVCLRLWTASDHAARPEHDEPEVQRVDMAATLLLLHAWSKDPQRFDWFEPPPQPVAQAAERLLLLLGALDAESGGRLTELGHRLAGLPIHPRLGRLLLAAQEAGLAESGAAVAALLAERDIVRPGGDEASARPPTHGQSDLLDRLDLLEHARRQRFAASLWDRGIDPAIARQVDLAQRDLLRALGRPRSSPPPPDSATAERELRRMLLMAYPDRVCRRRGSDPLAAVMTGGGGVRLARESVVRTAEFFLALDVRHDERARAREALVRIASAIEPQWLEELFPAQITRSQEVTFDEQVGRVIAQTTISYRDLVLRQDRDAPADAEQASAAFLAALAPRVRGLLESDESASAWLARLELLRQAMPEHPWPRLEDRDLAELLAAHAPDRRSLEDVRRLPLAAILGSSLPPALARLLESQAPAVIQVPSGSRVRVQYATGQPPVLAVRLQELFGWTQAPRIAGGRVPVVLHLLGPNFRPVQVTSDLASFWARTYPQVRKDLRARYPRHSWPEDPLTASPQAKGGRSKS